MRWTKLCLVLGPRKTVRPKSSLRTNVQLPCVWVGARSRAGLPKVLSRLCERADISSLYQVSRLSNESRRDFRARKWNKEALPARGVLAPTSN
jgi:hypothetical protein